MIQRKQTLFIFFAVVALLVCAIMPLATLTPKGMGAESTLLNIALVDGNGKMDFSACPLLVWLALSCVIGCVTIFKYKNRMLQASLCAVNMLFMAVWMCNIAAMILFIVPQEEFTWHFSFTVCLPIVAFILYFIARRAIIADEKLVKAADRIR